MAYEKLYQTAEKIEKMLDGNGIFADIYEGFLPDTLEVEIRWGDWKHEHARAKYLIKEMGYEYLGTRVIEEDGSDCYSAIHVFNIK